MKWQTREEVQEAAKSDQTALECSIEHWRQLSESNPNDPDFNSGVSADRCALCMRSERLYGFVNCSTCPLGSCKSGTLYQKANLAYRRLKDNPTKENEINWQITAKNMYLQLLGLKEPELEHGDKILWDGDVLVYLELINSWETRDRFLLFDDGSYFKNDKIEEELANANYIITENIFEE